MFQRILPKGATSGWTLHLHRGRIAPGVDGAPLQGPGPWSSEALPLGYWRDEPVALVFDDDNPQAAEDWPDGRAWLANMPQAYFPLLSTALQVASWWQNHRFCGRCGSRARHVAWEFAMHCDACGHRNYPRISPCIITLVTHGDAMLLGRSPRFPVGRYSTLAGFIEPGESAEEAVRREVFEEVGVSVGRTSYFRSQAWPFPHSLMLGYFAEAASRDIRIDDREIADAAWFLPEELPELPPTFSISRQLIDTHLKSVSARGQ